MFDRFPFLLPNLVCAIILVVGVMIGILFLEETHELKKNRRDIGLDCGRWILSRIRNTPPLDSFTKADDANLEESRSLIEDEEPPGYRTTEGSPQHPLSRSQSPRATRSTFAHKQEIIPVKSRGAHKVFTRQIVLTIAAFGILA